MANFSYKGDDLLQITIPGLGCQSVTNFTNIRTYIRTYCMIASQVSSHNFVLSNIDDDEEHCAAVIGSTNCKSASGSSDSNEKSHFARRKYLAGICATLFGH